MKTKLLSVGIVVFFLLLAMPAFAAVDLNLASVGTTPADVQPNEVVTITIGIENLGSTTVSDATLAYIVKKDGSTKKWLQ